MSDLQFRALTEDDLDAMLDVRRRSFGPLSPSSEEWWRSTNLELVGERRCFGVFDRGVLAAAGKARGFEQCWHGRFVPMAGMAGITVLPEHRGRGVGTLLMRGLAEESVRRAEPISALYPATLPVYRRLGWEFAGVRQRFTLAADHLRSLGGAAAVRRAVPEDAEELRSLCHKAFELAHMSGPLLWSSAEWRRRLEDEDVFVYRTDDGVVVYGWEGPDLEVEFLWAGSEDTARRLWSLVGSGSSTAKMVHAYLAPDDPVFWLLPEEGGHEVIRHSWMLKILDVPKALAARGYSQAAAGSIEFSVDDPERPDNSGTWRFTVEGGRGVVEPGGAADGLGVSPRGLAALYAGKPVAALRHAGLVTGGDVAADSVVDDLFRATAYLTDYF